MDSLSRKRRVSDVFSSESLPASKKSNQNDGPSLEERKISFQTPIVGLNEPVNTAQGTMSVPSSVATIRREHTKIITPQSSFQELRRVSVSNKDEIHLGFLSIEDDSTLDDAPESDDSSSDVLKILESDDDDLVDVVAPSPFTTFVTEPSRVSPVECCDPEQVGQTLEAQTLENRTSEKSAALPEDVEALPGTRVKAKHSHGLIAVITAALAIVSACFLSTPVVRIDDPNAIYVPGGGFSGFWFTLGRLNSIGDPLEKKYYCYSAGCLGVATMLSNVTMEAAYGYAVGAQKRWQRGELSRYDVTESFVNDLLYNDRESGTLRSAFSDKRVLSTLRIITSERDTYMGVKASVRTPTNAYELKEMLLQTAWIPFAISRDLWHEKHMDGAFTLHEHPQCLTNLGYSKYEWDLMLNALNVNLGFDKVLKFWQKGLALGLDQ